MSKCGLKMCALFLAVVMAVGIAGCGGKAGSDVANSAQSTTGASDVESIRSARATEFAYAVFTNTQIVNGSLQGVKTRESDIQRNVDPNAELYKWSPTSHDNLGILMQGGSPNIARNVEVVDIDGDVYYLTVYLDTIENLNPLKTSSHVDDIVVIFNDKNLIEHAYYKSVYESGKLTN